jgi:exonuclease SbcC
MILESIEIKNIRSIQKATLEFPSSTMLFFGDVGSGKSSVLKSIEFALFGTLIHGELGGDSLLRRGKKTGSVKLAFSIDGKKYTIQRSLVKGKNKRISQKECTFVDHAEGTNITLAPTDMRRKILSLFSYSVSRYEKATKLPLFRYTVYTPQEQIKEIIQTDPDNRFEILKEVFGIEKYEIALKNDETIKEFLNDKTKETKIKLEQTGEPDKDIPIKENEIESITNQINKIKGDIKSKEIEIVTQEKKINKIREELDVYTKKLIQIENKESNIRESKAKQKKASANINKIRKEISDKEEEKKKLRKIELLTDLSENQLEKQLENLQISKSQNETELAIIKKSLKDVDQLLEEGKCSLCGQSIHEKERFEKELQESSIKVLSLTNTIKKINSQLNDTKKSLKNLRDFQKIETKRESVSSLLSEKKKRVTDLEVLVNDIFTRIHANQEEIKTILAEYKIINLDKFKKLAEEITAKIKIEESEIKKLKSNKETAGNKLSVQKKSQEYLQKELSQLKLNLQTKELLQKNLNYYSQLKNWVGIDFPILIRDIEKKILSSSAHHFNSYFKEWFHELVEDKNIEVEIRTDDFQPIIYVNGYESPFEDLSGGEKSGLSLAYRLALNKIINERYQEVKTKDLLILDEPTDGFSQEQINRMQPIFEKLDTSQMIIISHDRNLMTGI